MDHEVEHDVDIQAPAGEDAQAVDLDEERLADDGERGLDGRVVALDVADLHDPPLRPGQGQKAVRLAEARGDRFLNQHVQPPLQEERRDLRVAARWCRDDRRLRLLRDRLESRQDPQAEFSRDLAGAPGIVVVDPDEVHAGQGRRDPRVLPPEVTNTHHGQTNRVIG